MSEESLAVEGPHPMPPERASLAAKIRTAFYDLDEQKLRGIFLDELGPVVGPVDADRLRDIRLALARGIARASIVYADVAADTIAQQEQT